MLYEVRHGVPKGSVFSPTQLILHVNDMLVENSIYFYTYNSTIDAVYLSNVELSRGKLQESKLKLVAQSIPHAGFGSQILV